MMERNVKLMDDRVIHDLMNGVGNDVEVMCTEDEARRQLLSWASRLEFESMDLRDRAKLLSLQLLKNSDVLKTTAESLKLEICGFKQSAIEPIDELVLSLNKVNNSIKSTNMMLGKQKRQLEEDVMEDRYSETIQMLRSISAQLDNAQMQRVNAIPNIQKGTNIDNRLNEMETNIKRLFQAQNIRITKNSDSILNKISQLDKRCDRLRRDFSELKGRRLSPKSTITSISRPITPSSSFSRDYSLVPDRSLLPSKSKEISEIRILRNRIVPIVEKKKSMNKGRRNQAKVRLPLQKNKTLSLENDNQNLRTEQHPIKFLRIDQSDTFDQNEFRCVSLLSDDLVSDDLIPDI